MPELDLIGTGIKTLAMLCIVIGLLILVLYLMKRFLFQRGEAKGDLGIRVLSSLPLSPKERIEVVEVAGEKIVLGVSPGSITFLTKLVGTGGKDDHEEGK